MSTPRARATTRHRHAEHTVVKAVSVTAATTACQVTARSPSSNGAAPTLPHEKPHHGAAGGQPQQRRAEATDGRTDPGRNRVQERHTGNTRRLDTWFRSVRSR